jgi:hypothetical protein
MLGIGHPVGLPVKPPDIPYHPDQQPHNEDGERYPGKRAGYKLIHRLSPLFIARLIFVSIRQKTPERGKTDQRHHDDDIGDPFGEGHELLKGVKTFHGILPF